MGNNPNIQDSDSVKLTHPWQGHWMEAAFTDFVKWASQNQGMLIRFTNKTGFELDIPAMPLVEHECAQNFIDWCVEQYGTPEQVFPNQVPAKPLNQRSHNE